jgi:predicted MFS family arabinose efflux permease
MSPLLFALFLATFAIGTTEFAVVGLLPDIAASLDVSISQTGLLVSGYASGVAIGGPVIVALTSSQTRMRTLLQLCAIFVVGHALAALAPDYGWLMSARVLAAVSHASFLGIAAIVAAGSVPPARSAAPCLSSGWVSPPPASSACQARPRSATRLAGAPPSGCSRRWRHCRAALQLWMPASRAARLRASDRKSSRQASAGAVGYGHESLVCASTFAVFTYVAPLLGGCEDLVGALRLCCCCSAWAARRAW